MLAFCIIFIVLCALGLAIIMSASTGKDEEARRHFKELEDEEQIEYIKHHKK